MSQEKPQPSEKIFNPIDVRLMQISDMLDPLVELERPRESVVWKAFCDYVDLQGVRSSKSHHTAGGMLRHIIVMSSIAETIRVRRNEDDSYDQAYEKIEKKGEDLIGALKGHRKIHIHDAPLKAYSRLTEVKDEYKRHFEEKRKKM